MCEGDILSFAQGAAVGVGYRTAYRALFEKAKIESGHWVLIRGASGGVGQVLFPVRVVLSFCGMFRPA